MKWTRPSLCLLAASSMLALCNTQPAAAQGQAQSVLVASGLTFPVYATAPEGDMRIFAVERAGRIRIVKPGSPLLTFLDISTQVSQAGEGGLLGLAFPPDYDSSGLFYVYYTNLANDSVVSRFSVTGNPDVADPNSEELVLFVDQPGFTNHKAGTIHFGPDGFLWFATGDGGGGNDPGNVAQNPESLLGKMLRIDPDPIFAPGYGIPADNPFADPLDGVRDEIWALGFRNPYRWSFDRVRGDIWIGDVGQGLLEEVDFESRTDPGGRNYGWDVMEGTACGAAPAPSPPAPPCNDPSLTRPVHQYGHSAGRCSITGGYVYHGDSSPLRGLYFFGDFCTGEVWTLDPANLQLEEGRVDRTSELGPAAGVDFALVGFGEDGFGRLLLVQHNPPANGAIYRIGSASPPPPGCGFGPELVAPLLLLLGLRGALRNGAARSHP